MKTIHTPKGLGAEVTRPVKLTPVERVTEENAESKGYVKVTLAQDQQDAESKARNIRADEVNADIASARLIREATTLNTGLVESLEVRTAREAAEAEAIANANVLDYDEAVKRETVKRSDGTVVPA